MARERRGKPVNKRCRDLSKLALLCKRRGAEGCGFDAEPMPNISVKRQGCCMFARLTPPPYDRGPGVPNGRAENGRDQSPTYNLLLQQAIDLQTRRLPEDEHGEPQLLIVLDEFARLGRAMMLAHGFSFLAGYGIRLLAVLQSPSQLREAYGDHLADEIMANCGVEVVFAPKDIRLAQALSERLGYLGQRSASRSRPLGLGSGRRSVTESEQRRALMLPQELIALPEDQLIVLRSGIPPVRARKLRYYQSAAFKRRVGAPPILKGVDGNSSPPHDKEARAGVTTGHGRLPAPRPQPPHVTAPSEGRSVAADGHNPKPDLEAKPSLDDRFLHRR